MVLSFHDIFAKELEVINFRRGTVQAHRRRAARTGAASAQSTKKHESLRVADQPQASYDQRTIPKLEGGSDLSGLALSGGGIRSAAFCLGVLQAIDSLSDHADSRVLDAIDYISTVSGGSYIGASLVAGQSQPDHTFPFESRLDEEETPETQHLRNYSNFLVPNGLSDYLISAILVARGLLVNAAIVLPFLLIPALVTIASNRFIDQLSEPSIFGWPLPQLPIPIIPGLKNFAITADLAVL